MTTSERETTTHARKRDTSTHSDTPSGARTTNRRARAVQRGDTAPELTPEGIERFELEQATAAARNAKLVALTEILQHEAATPGAAVKALEGYPRRRIAGRHPCAASRPDESRGQHRG